MELRYLLTFVAIAETGSFTAAAKRCGLTQSAVSLQIKQLETELNTHLVIRQPHRVILTESGAAVLQYAKSIIKEETACREHIANLNNCLCGELNLGIGSFIEPYIRKAALKMMEAYPHVRLNVEFGKSNRLNQLLHEHKIDLAFTLNTAHNNEGIQTIPCIPIKLKAIMSDTHPLAHKKIITLDDIKKHQIIIPDINERVEDTIRQYVDIDLSSLHIRAVVNSASAILYAIEEINCMTFMPSLLIERHPNLVAIPVEGLERDFMSNAHYMKDVAMKKAAEVFLGFIREYSVPYFKAIE